MAIRAVIFDCDGVLFHSERANIEFYKEVLRRAGLPDLPSEADLAYHSLASAQLFEKYFGDRPHELARVKKAARKLDYGPFYKFMEPRAGLHEVLGGLKKTYFTAMATNRGISWRGVLDHFNLTDLLDYAIGAGDVEQPKPHPEMLLKCAEYFSLHPTETVYVGDQSIDAQSAAGAGAHFVGVGAIAQEAEISIRDLGELPAVVEAL